MDIAELTQNYDAKRWTEARSIATSLINGLFGNIETHPDIFDSEGEFFTGMEKLNRKELTIFLSNMLGTIDYYARLNEGHEKPSDYSPDKVLNRILRIFPGHLMAQRAVSMIQNKRSDLRRRDASGKYESSEIETYDDTNLQKLTNSPPITFVDDVVLHRNCAPEGGIVPYVIAASHIFNRECVEPNIDEVIAQESTKLGSGLSRIYQSVIKKVKLAAKERLKGGIAIFAREYDAKSSNMDIALEGAKAEYYDSSNKVLEFVEKLPALLIELKIDGLEFLVEHNGLDYMQGFGNFDGKVGATKNGINHFMGDDSIDEQYRNRDKLLHALNEYRGGLNSYSKDFFNRLKQATVAGHVTDLNAMVEVADIEMENCEIMEKLGAGVSSVTWKYHSTSLAQDRAVKILNEGSINEEEARLMAKIKGENLEHIVQVHHAGDNVVKVGGKARYAILMEYLDGRTMKDVLSEEGAFKPDKVMNYGRQLLDGISSLRQYKIFHRDLRPENVMICNDGTIKIIDFGISVRDSDNPRDNRRYGGPDDLFSLGLIMYKMATGEHLILSRQQEMSTETYANQINDWKGQLIAEEEILPQYQQKIKALNNPLSDFILRCFECSRDKFEGDRDQTMERFVDLFTN